MKREGYLTTFARTIVKTPKHEYMSDPDKCPVCKNEVILQDGSIRVISSKQLRRHLYCEECKAEWTEVFQLSNIVKS